MNIEYEYNGLFKSLGTSFQIKLIQWYLFLTNKKIKIKSMTWCWNARTQTSSFPFDYFHQIWDDMSVIRRMKIKFFFSMKLMMTYKRRKMKMFSDHDFMSANIKQWNAYNFVYDDIFFTKYWYEIHPRLNYFIQECT